MRRRAANQAEAPGQDSFLDVVANLVGILIILVMVVGSQAKQAFIAEETQNAPQPAPPPQLDVAGEQMKARTAQQALLQANEKLQRQVFEVSYRKAERDELQLAVSLAEQELEEKKSKLTSSDQDRLDLQTDLDKSRGELSRLGAALKINVKPPPTAIQHLPTPMAKTVFGEEIHFRLLSGRICYVPWEEMVQRLQADAKQKVNKLREVPRIEETLPAISGFAAKYALRRNDIAVQTRTGEFHGTAIELERIALIEVEEQLGETVDEALKPESTFWMRMKSTDPNKTTVTFWVYPDSFVHFREVKRCLYQKGYLTAARPLPDGMPIMGAPNGTRSVAQ